MKFFLLFSIVVICSCQTTIKHYNTVEQRDSIFYLSVPLNQEHVLKQFDSLKIDLDANETNNAPILLK
ncbi:hypothetical protein HX004_02025 [Myroides sp. 1354]|uniref:hypothetical protein n=1 Tax=unclassified Myroides TaxID=2642485 RepID=UPI002577FE18|nr:MULTISPECIES: hypothetical protein [unclassified Myroides]MDM1043383.1 hypothetical protein [Myroides sp. R163-1]MDM1054566.1 hypothetical protein [Myroides sp. 1354]MDM1067863.1 hypothetical protein [Myroides sp. 1372]